MNIVFFGNPLFSSKCLEHLNNIQNINIELVVTNTDKRKSKFRRGIASLRNIGLIATFKKVMLHIYSRFMSYKNI